MKKLLAFLTSVLVSVLLLAMPPRHNGPPLEIPLGTDYIILSNIHFESYTSFPSILRSIAEGIPMGSFTYFYDSGGLYGSNTNGEEGYGVSASVSAGIITLTANEMGYGIAYAYTTETINGKKVLVLKVKINTPGNSYSQDIIVTPEMLGLDPELAAYRVLTGQYVTPSIDLFIEGSLLRGGGSSAWVDSYRFYYGTIGSTTYPDF